MKIHTITGAAVMALAISSPAQAAFITGTVNFTGGAVLQDSSGNVTTSLANATGVRTWVNPRVLDGSGSFSILAANTPVILTSPWVFNPSSAANPLWQVGGFSFRLDSTFVATQSASFLAVGGTGTLTREGFDPTPGSWYYTTQGTASDDQTYSWSSSTVANQGRVPDGGSTFALLGACILGLGGLRRKS